MTEMSFSRALSAAQSVADAVSGNWVDEHAPLKWRPFLRLSRADRPIGTWLLYIPCLWAVALAANATGWRLVDIWLVIGSGIGAFLMRGAGCTWNDIQDREFDARVERTRSRPIPSGQVSVEGATVWMIAQSLLAFLILLTFNWTAIALGILSLAFVAVYPFAKRFTWWPQVFLGLAFNWGALLLWTAHTGSLGLAPLLLYGAGIAWTLHYDTIYAHQDRDDDALIGVKSTARLFGEATGLWLGVFTSLTVVLAAGAVIMAGGGGLGLFGVCALGLHMVWQAVTLNINDPERCLKVFRATKWGGLFFVLGLTLDAII